MTEISELQERRQNLYVRQRELEAEVRIVQGRIADIMRAGSEWKIGHHVTYDGKKWLVIAISDDGRKPLLKQFLSSGKLGARTTWPYWFSDDRKPVPITEEVTA